jgi:hypothetical protein
MPFIIALCHSTSPDPLAVRCYFREVANPSDPTDYGVTSSLDLATRFPDLLAADRARRVRNLRHAELVMVNDPLIGSCETTRRALLGLPSEAKIIALTNALRAAGATLHRDGDGVRVSLADGSTVGVL